MACSKQCGSLWVVVDHLNSPVLLSADILGGEAIAQVAFHGHEHQLWTSKSIPDDESNSHIIPTYSSADWMMMFSMDGKDRSCGEQKSAMFHHEEETKQLVNSVETHSNLEKVPESKKDIIRAVSKMLSNSSTINSNLINRFSLRRRSAAPMHEETLRSPGLVQAHPEQEVELNVTRHQVKRCSRCWKFPHPSRTPRPKQKDC